MIVDAAVYSNGVRDGGRRTFEDAAAAATGPERFAWVGLSSPTPEELDRVRTAFGLHPLAIEDAVHTHERPRVDFLEDTVTVVLRPARYIEIDERVEFGQITILASPRYVVSVRHGNAVPLTELRSGLERDPDRLAHGPAAVVHAIFDEVVEAYLPVIAGIQDDVDEVEAVVFSDTRKSPTERIYYLKREVLELSKATKPLSETLNQLMNVPHPAMNPEMVRYFADANDDLLRVEDQVQSLRELLSSALEANLTQVSIRQNEDMRKMSAWAAILAVPTMIAGIYGMNFQYMPELEQRWGYPVVLSFIALVCVSIYRAFRKAGWL